MSDENQPITPPPSVPDYTPPPPTIPEPVPYTPPVHEAPPVADPFGAPPTPAAPPKAGATALPEGPPFGSGKLSEADDKMFCILSIILCIVVGFLSPLLFWLLKKDESPAVEAYAKESLNFQLTLLIAYVVFGAISCGFLCVVPYVYGIIMCIIATMKANEGILYRYPITLRLIK